MERTVRAVRRALLTATPLSRPLLSRPQGVFPSDAAKQAHLGWLIKQARSPPQCACCLGDAAVGTRGATLTPPTRCGGIVLFAATQASEQQQLERRLAAMAREVSALTKVKALLGKERESLKRQSTSLHEWLSKPAVAPPQRVLGQQQQQAAAGLRRAAQLSREHNEDLV